MRLLYFGDAHWAADSLRRLALRGHEIAGVVIRSRPSDTTLEKAAHELGLPVFQPERVNDAPFLEKVKTLRPDLNLSVSYDQILKSGILASAPLGFINFHAGKLPFYRGRSVINWAIINGEEEIGVTAHYVDGGIDTGDIILQRTVRVEWTDTYAEVLAKVIASFPGLVMDAVQLIADGRAVRQPQAHLAGTYFAGRREGDEGIGWSDGSRNIYNKIRGIARPGPGARARLEGRQVTVWKSSYDPAWPTYIAIPGQVVGRRPDGVSVKTGDKTLLVHEIQMTGEAPCVPRWKTGTRLEDGP